MSQEERVSLVEVTTIEWREKRVEVVVADTEITEIQSEKQVVAVSQAMREIEDDWFVLLDVPAREPSFVPGIVNIPSSPTKKTYRLIISVL